MKKIIPTLALLLGIMALVVVVRTIVYTPKETADIEPVTISVDAKQVSQHLAQAIRIRTISLENQKQIDYAAFEDFISWAEQTYPEVHTNLERGLFGRYSMLFKWQGTKPTLPPILLTAHYDVVPVASDTNQQWIHPPFSGVIADDHIWGRGALDDKGAVIAMLEAVTILIKNGFVPERSLYLSFGHDEEIGGLKGAAEVTNHLKNQGIQLAWTLDEGSFIFEGAMFGVAPNVAVINVAEKGYLTLEIVATSKGGHSSMPPPATAVESLANALVKLQASPIPGGLVGLSGEMFDSIARHMPFTRRLLFANRWLFGSLIEKRMSTTPFANAILKTTIAPTMLEAGTKENVLPTQAKAVVNFRLHPRDSIESVTEYVRKTLRNPNIEVRVREKILDEASPISDVNGPGFIDITQSVREIYGNELVIAPGIMVAASDSRHYSIIADNSYRFTPMILKMEEIPLFHGTNERVSIDNIVRATKTYARLLENAAGSME